MGRLRRAAEDEGDDAGVDMSPLIDCVFILLIFFIVTTVFVEETGVEVDRPQASASENLESNSLLIAITKSGRIMHADQAIGVAGVGTIVRRAVLADSETPVIIQSDQGAPAGILIQVTAEARAAGAKKVSAATSDA